MGSLMWVHMCATNVSGLHAQIGSNNSANGNLIHVFALNFRVVSTAITKQLTTTTNVNQT